MRTTTLKCPACAAVINITENQSLIKCDYCQNQINIIKPITTNGIVEGLDNLEQKKYDNYLTILNQSMLAGNYSEAYNYCNKALEINPKSASLWENKAICAFWLSSIANLAEDKAAEIITYLNASKQNDPNSSTYESTASSIAENLYYCVLYKYNNLGYDERNQKGIMNYSFQRESEILSCIRVVETCFQIYPRVEYLEYALQMISNGKIKWLYRSSNNYFNTSESQRHGFDAVRKRNLLLEQINKLKPTEYKAPIVQTKSNNALIVTIISFIILFFLIFICAILGK